MKRLILFLLISLVSCRNEQNEKGVPIPLPPPPIQIVTSYAIVKVKTEEPVLLYSESKRIPSDISNNNVTGYSETVYTTIPESASVKWIENMHISDIFEVEDFTEDDKYKLMDNYKKILDLELDNTYTMDVHTKVKDFASRESLLQNKTSIKSRNVDVYKTYKEASQAKEILSEIWRRSVEEELTGKPMNIKYN